MGIKTRAGIFLLSTIVLTGCALVPLSDSPSAKMSARSNNSPKRNVHDRTYFRIQSISPSYVTVKKGDTVYSLSRKYNVPTRSVIELNRLKTPFLLYAGQRLKLPKPVIHVVRKGDTVYSISRRYNVDMSLLVRQNKLKEPYNIYEGQFLKLPGSIVEKEKQQVAQKQPVNLVKGANVSGKKNSSVKTAQKTVSSAKATSPKTVSKKAKKPTPKNNVRLPAPPQRTKAKFAWPVDGIVITKFGAVGAGRHNDGINIKVDEGTSVRAAESGVVAYAGNELKGFGNLLLVKHNDGWITAYAHNKLLLVKRGQTVKRGQSIAKAGKTGNVQGAQLHFEIRKGTKAVDPLAYMEKK